MIAIPAGRILPAGVIRLLCTLLLCTVLGVAWAASASEAESRAPQASPPKSAAVSRETAEPNAQNAEEAKAAGAEARRERAGEAASVEPPVLVHFVEAAYPEEAAARGIEGVVRLSLVIDESGKVADATVVERAGHGFDEAALEAVRRFRFEPARLNGHPIAVQVSYEYAFTLERKAPSEAPASEEAPLSFRGRVLERGTRRPLEGAIVHAGPASTETDSHGRFELYGLPAGTLPVRILAPGHEPLESTETFAPGEVVEATYWLLSERFDPYEVVVHGRRPKKEVTRRTLTLEEVQRIPGTRGDALRVVQTLPGVARTPYGLGPLVVRGSGPYDSRAFLDGHWIPLPFHFGGLTSIFNGDLIDRIDLYPGNYPARFGRSLAGVLQIETRPGRTDGHHGYVDADLYDVGFLLEGPLAADGTSYAVAARRSYVDAFLNLALRLAGAEDVVAAPFYYDYQARLHHPLGGGHALELTVYGSHDELRVSTRDPELISPEVRDALKSRFDFHRVNVALHGRLDDRLRHESSLTLGWDATGNSFGTDLFFDGDLLFVSGRSDWSLVLTRRLRMETGIDLFLQRYGLRAMGPPVPAPGRVLDPAVSEQDLIFTEASETLLLPALYADLSWEPGLGLRVVPGLRVDADLLAERPSITVDPRLTLLWEVDRRWTVKAGAGRYSQPPLSLQLIPGLGNPYLGWEHAYHFALGAEHRLLEWLSLDLELFLQVRRDLVARSARYVERNGEVVRENFANTGEGRAYGLELYVKVVEVPGLTAWLSYTLSRSEQRHRPDERFRLYSLDQTHNLVALASYDLGHGWSVGGLLRFVTGIPTTPILGAFYDADVDTYLPIPGRTATGPRVPPFFSLDLRVDRRFTFRRWMLTLYLDVTNATNHGNVEAYTYNYDFTERRPLYGLPIFPSVGVKGEF